MGLGSVVALANIDVPRMAANSILEWMNVTAVFEASPHVVCEVGPLHAWFTEPRGVVVQLMEAAPVTTDMARWLVGPGFEQLLKRFASPTELTLVLDIRPMTERDRAVRTLLMDHAREHVWRFADVVVIPPLQINAVYLTTLHAAAALLGAFGAKVRIESSVPQALQKCQLAGVSAQ